VHRPGQATGIPEEDNINEDAGFNSLSVVIETSEDLTQTDTAHTDEEISPAPGPRETAAEEAENILREAKEQAEQIREEARQALRDAQKRGEEIESRAYSTGFDQGKKDGEDIGRKQYLAVAQRLERLISRISEGAEALLPQYESQMVEVAMNAARHIVDREIKISPEIVLESIRAAMEQVVEGSAVHLHLNPADIDALEGDIREKFVVPGRQGLDIVNDPRIDRGGCLIETEYGLVDATTRAKWQAVSDTIKKILAERTGALPAAGKTAEEAEAETDEERQKQENPRDRGIVKEE
jgi:flagellar assembly protein FliH